jgi:hypothetical protein
MHKAMKFSFGDDDCGSKECKRDYGGTHSGGLAKYAFCGILQQAVGFFRAFGRNLISVAVKTTLYLVYFIKECIKRLTFNAICKGNAAIKYMHYSST